MKIKLKNNIEINITGVSEAIRRSKKEWILDISFQGNYSVSELEDIFLEENINEITIIDDNNNEKILNGYNKIDTLNIDYNKENLIQSDISIILLKKEVDY